MGIFYLWNSCFVFMIFLFFEIWFVHCFLLFSLLVSFLGLFPVGSCVSEFLVFYTFFLVPCWLVFFFNVCYLEYSVVFLIFLLFALHCFMWIMFWVVSLSACLFPCICIYLHVLLFLPVDFQVHNAAPSAAPDLQLFSEDAKLKPTWWYKEESMCEEKTSVQHCSNWALPNLQYLDIMSELNYHFYRTTDFWEIK